MKNKQNKKCNNFYEGQSLSSRYGTDQSVFYKNMDKLGFYVPSTVFQSFRDDSFLQKD